MKKWQKKVHKMLSRYSHYTVYTMSDDCDESIAFTASVHAAECSERAQTIKYLSRNVIYSKFIVYNFDRKMNTKQSELVYMCSARTS